jgi:tetratricopeptide (TPR) repeat protein/predicted Ser/Thr protein kinase
MRRARTSPSFGSRSLGEPIGSQGDPTVSADAAEGEAAHGSTLPRGYALGRYIILSELGSGGMGVVYMALDPELDRRVAVKLLRNEEASEGARVRLLREAQALARLSHPNVVTIHDVGEHEGQIYIAMEYVEGSTLTQWCKAPRTWKQVLDTLVRAGEGLAAAHEGRLVHRDFKPDNVMVGRDGRVRVMDFGLARGQVADAGEVESTLPGGRAKEDAPPDPGVTRGTGVVGTPAYMSPEQHRGDAVDARTDQFSFCVTLWEALYGQRPFAGEQLPALVMNVLGGIVREPPSDRGVPSWLRRAIERGLRVDRTERYESMNALLEAIEQHRRRARNGRRLAVALAGLGVAALVAGAMVRSRHAKTAACEREGQAAAAVWPGRIDAVREGIAGAGLAYAETLPERLAPWLDKWATEWGQATEDACRRLTISETMAPDVHRRVVGCLDLQRVDVETLVEGLAAGDPVALRNAVPDAADLPSPAECMDLDRLARMAWPDDAQWNEVQELRRSLVAQARPGSRSELDAAIERARGLVARAEAVGFAPLVAEAQLALGETLQEDDYAGSEAAFRAAYFGALAVDAPNTAATAAERLVRLVGSKLARPDEALEWAEHARALSQRVDDEEGLLRARLDSSVGTVIEAKGDYTEAARVYEGVLAVREAALGPEHPEVAVALNMLATAKGRNRELAEAERLLRRVIGIRERTDGPGHPFTIWAYNNLATALKGQGRLEEAQVIYERNLGELERLFGDDHFEVTSTLNNLGNLLGMRGRNEEALAYHERALKIRETKLGPTHPEVATSLGNRGNILHSLKRHEEARADFQRALEIVEAAFGPEHPGVAQDMANLAAVHEALGDYEKAESFARRSVELREKLLGPSHVLVAASLLNLGSAAIADGRAADAIAPLERSVAIRQAKGDLPTLLAESRFELARALEASGADEKRAIELAREALAAYRAAGAGVEAEIERIVAWQAEHDREAR